MSSEKKRHPILRPNYKLWLEHEGDYAFGPGAYRILKSINEAGTITQGAKNLGMSYRYAWGVIRKIEKKLGVKLLDSYKGGNVGGGGARVTDYGLRLMETYSTVNNLMENALRSTDSA
ncbi:MAG: winged helix-turn-helix domain-containing protein [Candidatus Thorarchaeota archaeon]